MVAFWWWLQFRASSLSFHVFVLGLPMKEGGYIQYVCASSRTSCQYPSDLKQYSPTAPTFQQINRIVSSPTFITYSYSTVCMFVHLLRRFIYVIGFHSLSGYWSHLRMWCSGIAVLSTTSLVKLPSNVAPQVVQFFKMTKQKMLVINFR